MKKFLALALTAFLALPSVGQAQQLLESYVDEKIRSEGAKIRAYMGLVPSLILLLYWRKWKDTFPNFLFWFWLSIGSIIGILLVNVASTAVDRMALYFIPLQIAVFSRLPYLAIRNISPGTVELGILAYYAAVLFVWLNFAAHARYWVPYNNLLF